jgi:hypothetical protein
MPYRTGGMCWRSAHDVWIVWRWTILFRWARTSLNGSARSAPETGSGEGSRILAASGRIGRHQRSSQIDVLSHLGDDADGERLRKADVEGKDANVGGAGSRRS